MSLRRNLWLLVLVAGLGLFALAYRMLSFTRDVAWVLPLVAIGALLAPVTFVTYVYARERSLAEDVHTPTVVACFVVGGLVGVTSAGILEYDTRVDLGVLPMLLVGLIEESVKLVVPLLLFATGRHRAPAAGLVFGVAAGMGFAALETTGYGFTTFVRSRGDVALVDEVLFWRGLLSPVGHAAWTGLVCSTLWRERAMRGSALGAPLAGAFATAVVLHTLWDSLPAPPGHVLVGALSLALLVAQFRLAGGASGPRSRDVDVGGHPR